MSTSWGEHQYVRQAKWDEAETRLKSGQNELLGHNKDVKELFRPSFEAIQKFRYSDSAQILSKNRSRARCK
jgi:hypothetical protein